MTTALAVMIGSLPNGLHAQVTYEDGQDGVRYQVTRRQTQRQVPVTVMQDKQQTVYRQQVTTHNQSHQQLYCTPVTQYRMVSRLNGRWNPFVTPYWTHQLKPVTHWQQQVATVQVPVTSTAWVPETRTVQVPVTTYRTASEETISRVAMNHPQTLATARPLTAFGNQSSNSPSATLAARPSYPASGPIGSRGALENDPPRQANSWRSSGDSRY